MENYVAVTIGPLGYTMSLFSKVVPLWVSSYLFSTVAKSICETLVENKVCSQEDIVVPYYDKNKEELVGRKDGVGLFHDRIIYKDSAGKGVGAMKDVAEEVYKKTAEAFDIDEAFLKNYLYVFACAFTVNAGENVILKSGKMLDCMELGPRFNTSEVKNAISEKFGKENDNVKKILPGLGIDGGSWQLSKDGKIKDTGSIADFSENGKGLKRNDYFCVLRSDGDGMGKVIEKLSNGEECRGFSEKCLEYCASAANAVKDFGGVTIYAGGDDLLALTPCENGKGETVFDLMEKLNGEFKKRFPECSLSFGLLICYKSFPLYEAMSTSYDLLFGWSKDKEKGGKNCATVRLLKHSGQSTRLIIKNGSLGSFIELLKKVEDKDDKTGPAPSGSEEKEDEDAKEKAFTSAGRKVLTFKTLFDGCDAGSAENLFKNTFDSAFHKQHSTFFHKTLCNYYLNEVMTGGISAYDTAPGRENEKSSAVALDASLRLMKFFIEKEGEK